MKRPAAALAKQPTGLKNPRNELTLRPPAEPDKSEDDTAIKRDLRKARKFNLQWKNGQLPDEVKVKLEQAKEIQGQGQGGYRDALTKIMNESFDVTATGKVMPKTPVFTQTHSKDDRAYHSRGSLGTFRYTLPWGPTTKSPSRKGKVCSFDEFVRCLFREKSHYNYIISLIIQYQ